MNDDFGLNSGYAGEIRHADRLLEATKQWCDSISSWAALCDVAAYEKEVQGWLQLQSYNCIEFAMNSASVRRNILNEEEREFHGLLVSYVSSLFVPRRLAPPVSDYEESITQQTTPDQLEELTTTCSHMRQQLKVVAEHVAQLVDLFANNTQASAGAEKCSSSSTGVNVPTVAKFAASVENPGATTSTTRCDTKKRAKGSTGSSTSAGVIAKETSSAGMSATDRSSAGVSAMETSSAGASIPVRAERVFGERAGDDTNTGSVSSAGESSPGSWAKKRGRRGGRQVRQQQAARQLLELLNNVAHDAPGKSRKKFFFASSSESDLDLLHVNLALSLRPCIDAISAPSAFFAGTEMRLCFVFVK